MNIAENPLTMDEVLVTRAREGDSAAFDVLVTRYQHQAVSIAFSVLRDWEVAKDASQNAFMKAFFGLKHFRQESAFKTWLIRIVLNEAKNAARKDRLRRFFVLGKKSSDSEADADDLFEHIPSQDKSPKEVMENKERAALIGQAIDELPDKEKNVFILRYVHEMPLSEIAEVLHIALGTVKAHLSHASEKMKRLLKDMKIELGGDPNGQL